MLGALRARPLALIGWSTVGFGLFCAPMTFAVASGPSRLPAGIWQVTILAGVVPVLVAAAT